MYRSSIVGLLAMLFAIGAAVSFAEDAGLPMPMSNYWFGVLRRGPSWTAERTAHTDSIQAGHMANIGRMAASGELLSAGPFMNNGDWRGIFIFRADSIAKVRAMAAKDPALESGRLVLDLYPWFAPAGIGEPYRKLAQQAGHRDSMITHQLVMLKRGPKWTPEQSPAVMKPQQEHVANIFAGLLSGRFAIAGPFHGDGPDSNYAGVIVIRGDSTAARQQSNADPMVKSGRLAVEIRPWLTAWGTMPGDTLR